MNTSMNPDKRDEDAAMAQGGPRLGGIPLTPGLKWDHVTIPDEHDTDSDLGQPASEAAPAPASGKAQRNLEAPSNTIVDEVSDFIKRFVFLTDETQYLLIALWMIATHLHEEVDFFGYLFAYSPEPQSGKTTLLDVLDLLVQNSTGVQHSPTEAVLFRTAAKSTHLLDEVDSWKNADELKSILNAGYKKGGVVTRCNKNRGFKPETFPVFAPRAMAGIGLSILPPSTLDRTFTIQMVRQKRSEKRERLRLRAIRQQAADLKGKIEKWAKDNKQVFANIYGEGRFPYLEGFSDRTIDIAEPLAAIVEVAYANDPRLERVRSTLSSAVASTRKEQSTALEEHRILQRLLELAKDEDTLVGNPQELATLCANSEETIDERTISQTLRKYGYGTRSIRKNGGGPLKRYELSKSSLEELVDRWVPKSDPGSVMPAEESSGESGQDSSV